MVTNLAYNQHFFNDEEPIIRPATIISSVVHFIILISAIYGLPNFNRKLPPDFIEIPVEILKVVDETNLEIKEKITQEYGLKVAKAIESEWFNRDSCTNRFYKGLTVCY